jgi:hypothetical protein
LEPQQSLGYECGYTLVGVAESADQPACTLKRLVHHDTPIDNEDNAEWCPALRGGATGLKR